MLFVRHSGILCRTVINEHNLSIKGCGFFSFFIFSLMVLLYNQRYLAQMAAEQIFDYMFNIKCG